MNDGEMIKEAAVREVKEETNLDVVIIKLSIKDRGSWYYSI